MAGGGKCVGAVSWSAAGLGAPAWSDDLGGVGAEGHEEAHEADIELVRGRPAEVVGRAESGVASMP